MTDRSTLEADLAHHRHNGDFVAQAETLFALAKIAEKEDEYVIAHSLYGQAWAAYEQIGDKSGSIKAIWSIANAMSNHIFFSRFERLPQIFDWWEIMRLEAWVMSLCEDIPDLRGRANTYEFISSTGRDSRTSISHIALHRALHCYEILNDDVGQLQVLLTLSKYFSVLSSEYAWYMDRVLDLSLRLKDKSLEAHTLYALGHNKKWTDLSTSREFLAAAHRQFSQLQDYKYMVKCILEINILTLRQSGYKAYLKHQLESIAQVYQTPDARPYLLPLWLSLINAARKHKDIDTARLAYQQAIIACISAGKSKIQGELYWLWGFMEYHDGARRSMGFALCRWAIALIRVIDPQSTSHQRQFKALCREMKTKVPRYPNHK